MISDLNILTRLEWKRFKASAAYWLSLIGFEPGASRFYLVYVLIFWLFWLYTVWAFVVDQVYRISQTIPAASVTGLRDSLPILIFILQILYLISVLRDAPLKLSAAEIEYVAASSADRGMMALVRFARSMLVPSALAGLAGSLAAMLLTWQSAPQLAGIAGLQALVIGVPLCLFSAAVGWIAAILRQPIRSRAARWATWLVIPAIVALIPQIMLIPGKLWRTALDGQMSGVTLTGAAALTVAALIGLVLAGRRVNMAAVADDSRMYARIQKLGIFARLYADDVIASVQRQSRLARKRHLRLVMSEDAEGSRVLLNRALLSLFRLAPSSMLRLVTRGIALAGTVSLIVRISGGGQLQTWVLLLMILIQFRPTELNAAFQQDAGQAFTRQFLPANPLRIAAAIGALPILLMSFGGLVTLLVQPWLDPLTAVVLVISVTAVLTWCQALELVSVPRLIVRRIPYTYAVLACGVVLIAAGYALRSAPGVALAAVILNLALAGVLYFSRM